MSDDRRSFTLLTSGSVSAEPMTSARPVHVNEATAAATEVTRTWRSETGRLSIRGGVRG